MCKIMHLLHFLFMLLAHFFENVFQSASLDIISLLLISRVQKAHNNKEFNLILQQIIIIVLNLVMWRSVVLAASCKIIIL